MFIGKNQGLLPSAEIALFCDQVAMLLSAGIPLSDGMETLCANYDEGKYKEAFSLIEERIKDSKLHKALEESGVFPSYLVSMVRIGERTGRLEAVLHLLSRYYAWEAEIDRAVKSAVLYPAILMLMLAAVVGVLTVTVLPVFDKVYAGLGVQISGAGAAVGRVTLMIIAAALLALTVILLLLRTDKKDAVTSLLSKLFSPFGKAMRKLSAARFASAIAIMLGGGYDVDEALRLAADVVPDARSRAATQECRNAMRDGKKFADAVAALGFFDAIHNRMIIVGEASGQLDTAMEKLSETYQREADQGIYYIVSLIEPLLVALLSIVIGGILLSVMLPMLNALSTML